MYSLLILCGKKYTCDNVLITDGGNVQNMDWI